MRLPKNPGMFLLCATLLIACRNQDSTINISLINKGPDTLSDRVSRMTRTLSPKSNSQVSGALKDLGAVGQFLGSEGVRQVSASIVGLVAQGGGTLVAQGGGTLVAQGGGTLVAQGGGTLVAQGGGTLVAQGGGTLVAQGGGTLVSSNGGTLISSNGGTLLSQADDGQSLNVGSLLRQLLAVRTSPDGKVTVTYNDRTGAIETVKSDLGDMALTFPSAAPTTGPRTRSLEASWNQNASGITGRVTLDWTGVWKPRAALTPRPAPSVAATCQPSIAPTPAATTSPPLAPATAPSVTPLPAMVLFDGELPETTEQAKLTATFGLPGDRTLAASVLLDTPKSFKDGSTEPSHLRLDLSLADTVFFADVNDTDGETRANGRLTTKGEKGSETYSFEVVAPDDGVGSLIIYSLDEREQAYFKLHFKLLPPTTPCGPRGFVGELFQPDSKARLEQKFADCLPVPENPNQLLIKFTNGQTVLWDFLTVAAE